jgi:hypothetical protein
MICKKPLRCKRKIQGAGICERQVDQTIKGKSRRYCQGVFSCKKPEQELHGEEKVQKQAKPKCC